MAAFKATFNIFLPADGTPIAPIALPFVGLAPYALDCTIDWGDGSPVETFVNYIVNETGPRPSHLYAIGTYQMSITGRYRGWNNDLDGASTRLISIDHWGDNVISFSSGVTCFTGCVNLVSLPTEGTVVFPSNCSLMFSNCNKLKSGLDLVDTSNVTNMSQMFAGCVKFNGNISKWNTQKVTNMRSMFILCISFRQDLSLWDVSSITSNDNAPSYLATYVAAVKPRFSSEYTNSWRFKAPVTSAVIATIFLGQPNPPYYLDSSLRLRLKIEVDETRFSKSRITYGYNTRSELGIP